MPDPRSDAIRVMGEVIQAQAAHIDQLENGRWCADTRKEMLDKRAALDAITDGPHQGEQLHYQPLENPWNDPSWKASRTLADVENDIATVNRSGLEHQGPHGDMHWPQDGQCARCDILRPLFDEREGIQAKERLQRFRSRSQG